jgi:hypothetical protein
MDETKFNKLLDDRGVVIVHFSHFAVMRHAVEFPIDLQHAIQNYQSETRSCCALWPGHKMELPGSVGVIFKPTFTQILSVLPDDSGSSDFEGSENSGGHAPSEETIADSLNVPFGRYNEWRIRGAEPIGIFVANPDNISAKKKSRISLDGELIEEIGSPNISLFDVTNAFPSLTIYTMGANRLSPLQPGTTNES